MEWYENKLMMEDGIVETLYYIQEGTGTSFRIGYVSLGVDFNFKPWSWDADEMDMDKEKITVLGPSCLAHW